MEELTHKGLAASTRQAYGVGARAFIGFLQRHSIPPILPASEFILMAFVATQSATCTRGTLDNYLAGIRSWHVDERHPLDLTKMPTLQRMLDGLEKEAGPRVTMRKLPVTPALIHQIIGLVGRQDHDDRLFLAIMVLCVYGLLRLGEVVPKQAGGPHTITLDDVKIGTRGSFNLLIKNSKTDQVGAGFTARYYSNSTLSCPFTSVISSYWNQRVNQHKPPQGFLQKKDGTEPTRAWVVGRLKGAIAKLGYKQADFSGHSFRRGGATALAAAGIEDHIIQRLGRWRSAAYQVYTVPTEEVLANAAGKMANTACVFGDLLVNSSTRKC